MIDGVKAYNFYTNLVTEDGHIYNAAGTELKIRKNGYVMMYVNGKKVTLSATRVVYEAITGVKLTEIEGDGRKAGRNFLTIPIDGDPTNIRFDNIKLVEKKDYYKNYDFRTSKYSKDIKKAIRRDYNREERAKHNFRGEWAHPTYDELVEKYGCSRSLVYNALKKETKEAGE